MSDITNFRFVSCRYDEKSATVFLDYAFDDEYFFTETIEFKNAKTNLMVAEKEAVNKILFFLHMACGISYYKAFIPSQIEIESGCLNKEQAEFFQTFYEKGLGEFSWRNGLNLSGKINFPYAEKPSVKEASEISLPDMTAVPIGGGKDSNVVLETLKSHGENVVCIAQGRPRPIKESIEVSECPDIEFTRTISPELIALNGKEGVYNGHVPISGIYAFCMTLAAVLYGYDKVAMGNERSANVGNLVRDDNFEVNHQWSKSIEFEQMFNAFNHKYMLANFNYFSFLRPLSELDIARRFAKLKPYHQVFTSCNKAFKIDKEKRLERWCGDCDKCRFVFLALAPFMDKEDLIKAVGKNILADIKQKQGYEELLGLSNHKPFECVGELEECCVAMYLLSQNPQWQNEPLVKELYPLVEQKYGLSALQKWQEQVFTPSEKHCLPEKFREYLKC